MSGGMMFCTVAKRDRGNGNLMSEREPLVFKACI